MSSRKAEQPSVCSWHPVRDVHCQSLNVPATVAAVPGWPRATMCQALWILHTCSHQLGMNILRLQMRKLRHRVSNLSKMAQVLRSGAAIQTQTPDRRDHNYTMLHDIPKWSSSTGEANQWFKNFKCKWNQFHGWLWPSPATAQTVL